MSQGPEGKAKDLWAKLGHTLRSSAETIVNETKELTKLGKLKVELMSLENERDRKFEDLGRSAHTLYKGGIAFPPEMADLFLSVDDVEKRIDLKRIDVDRLKAEGDKTQVEKPAEGPVETSPEAGAFCLQCGAKLEPGDAFCRKCGAKIG